VRTNESSRFEVKKKLDIRGKVCPMTYVYTKITLEKMNSGDILEVILDFPGAIRNIPKSAKQQNLGETIEIKEIVKEKVWILLIKRI
jgi:tRNA 2-thiouridine synthesizing protein A